jgi:hypothetical protein
VFKWAYSGTQKQAFRAKADDLCQEVVMKLLRPLRWLLLISAVALIPAVSRAEVVISVGFAPPPLLVYDQPPCPGPDLIWTPGYWAYGPDGYYWVPGAWVPAPYEGALWTPGYWGWDGGMYYWHPGYWGPHVGYYGGINYGFGYFGIGFVGGRWNGGFFEYNTAVWHVDRDRVRRVYEDRDWNNHYVDRRSHVAFSGGPGGIRHDPDRDERAYMRDPHMQRTTFQTQHIEAAQRDRNAYYNVNHGRPAQVAISRPLPQENHPAPGQRNGFNNQRGNMNNGGRNTYQQPNRGQQVRPQQPQQPQYRTQPEYRQVPPQRQVPESRPPQPESRPQPQPQARPQQPQYRPQPEYRQVPPERQVPQSRPQETQPQRQPEYRPQPQPQRQPESRPQPQARPQERPQPQQRPESRGNGGERPQQHDDRGHDK